MADPILIHTVQHDLSRAAVGGLADPVECAAPGVLHLVGVTGMRAHDVAPVDFETVDADDDTLLSELAGELIDQGRAQEGRGVDADLVGTCGQARGGCRDGRDAASNAEWDGEARADAADPVRVDLAVLGGGGDVVKDKLVRALVGVALGEVLDLAYDFVVSEPHALDHHAVSHVEAGDDAPG